MTEDLLRDILEELRSITSTLSVIDNRLETLASGYNVKDIVEELSNMTGNGLVDLAMLHDVLSDIKLNTDPD